MAVLKYGQAAKTTLPTATAPKETAAANGGFWDSVSDVGQGIGYLAEKVGLGFLSTFEGMWDYSAGGIASMFGNNEWAEQQFKDDWVDYSHPDTWYQPSDGWKTAGDIASGIGNSAASLVPYGIAAAVSFFSAGTLAPVAFSAASWASVGTAGLGAAGQSTKQAYQETGELGGKEYGYGFLSGATEAALEKVTGFLDVGGEAVVKSLSKAAARKAAGEAAQVVAKKSMGKILVDGFVGEAFEEGMSAILEPEYAKLTYNPNAQSATPQEIAYSAFVGGMSGMIMGGASQGISNATTRYQDSKRGKELVKQGKQDSILEMARQIAETERNTPTGDHAFEYTKDAYDKLIQSLATTDGKVTDASQERMLGEVARWSAFSAFSPMISKSAANIYQNAEAFAERLNAYYSSVGGNMSVTAEDIRNGLDPKDPKTFKTALETNPTLRMLAIADATGHLFLDSTRFAQAAAEGRGIATQDDINRLLETADEAKINALSQRYGVDLRTATASEFNKAVTQYMQNGGYDTEMGEVRRSKAAKGADEKTAKTKLPKAIALKDGETVRYKIGDEDFSITREGDGYYLHDNKTDRTTRKLTKAEVNKRLADYRQQVELSKPDTRDNAQKKTAETVDAWAGENVIGYNKLGNADKVGIRRLINTARAMGVSDADIAIYASISARSGVKITFESKPDADYKGYYSHKDNLITINLAKTKSAESTIIHEFDHAIRTVDGDFYIPLEEAADALTDAEFMQVMEAYSKETAMGKADELTAHGAEKLLAGQGVLTRLMDEQPKLLDRVLAFFKGAESDYKALPRLSKEAKRYYKKYKKMFDALSYRNAGGYVAPGDAVDFRYNRAAVDTHQKTLKQKYNEKSSPVPLEKLLKGYERIVTMWDGIGQELNSEFLNRWNERKQDKAFTVFKAQEGYDYNIELSSMCKKGIPLFEAIDTIVRDEAMAKHGINRLGKAEKEVLYDVLKSHDFEIPCAICFVEQARQREGAVIDAFVKGNAESGKLGWNEVLGRIESRMRKTVRGFTFGKFDRSIAEDSYVPTDVILTEAEQKAFYSALAEEAMTVIEEENRVREEWNKEHPKKQKKILPNVVTAEGIEKYLSASTQKSRTAAMKAMFGGALPANIKIFKVLLQDPNARRRIDADLLYSSVTTRNIAVYNRDFYDLFNAQGGTAGYKTKQSAIAYWGDLLAKNGKKWNSNATRRAGGIRNQSNSDFQVYQFLDYVQMYIDLTAKGFYLQAYSKSVAELKLFGKSSAKMNASLIPAVHRFYDADGTVNEELTRENAGLDENGNPIYDDVEGINHTEAFALIRDPEYSKNITGICIGYSDKHILKLLDIAEVQMIIGYHDKTNDPTKRYRGAVYATNYTGRNEAQTESGETLHINFTEYIIGAEGLFKAAKQYDSKTDTYRGSIEHNGKTYKADDIPKLAADLYLEMCAEKGLSPAYSRGGTDFTKHPNYYKLLADYGLKDSEGHYAPHRKVAFALPDTVPVLAADGAVSQMGTQEYLKAQLQSELEVRDRIARDLADTSENGIIPQFVKGVEQLRQEQRDGGVRVAAPDASEIRYSKAGYDPETAGVQEQIKNAQYELSKMDVVFSSKVPTKVGNKYDAGTWAIEQLRRYGFQAERQGFGRIYFTEKEIRDAMNYLDTDGEKVSIVAIYKVLKQGIQIGEHGNHKNRGKHTVTFAAPVELNGIRGNMAVVVNMRKNKYKVHRILMPDGSVFKFEEQKNNAEQESQRGVPERSLANATSSASTPIIPQNSADVNPSDENSVRKSKVLTDSQGNPLTQEQADYFKDSLVRDENGNLKVVYHGSGSQFTVFSHRFIGRHGSSEGQGFYFTDSENLASGYAKEGGQLLRGYLDIKKPLYDDKVTLTRAQIDKLIRKIDPTGDDLVANYDSQGGVGYPSRIWYERSVRDTVRAVMQYAESDSEILAELANSSGDAEKVLTEVRRMFGYDGYIVHGHFGDATVYVAFTSEQFKNADNVAPTPDPDIRYSRSLTETDRTYLAAVERSDMATAQRMVREAATAARYDSPMLYHGTDSFGFTEVRTTGVEKGHEWSPFFATNRKQTAGTYTNNANVREISEQMTEEHYEKVMDDVNEEINDEIDNFRYLIGRTFSEWYFGQTDNSGLRDDFDNANAEQGYGDGIYDVFEGYIADAYYQYQDSLSDAYEDYSEWLDESEEAQKLINSVIALEGLRRKLETLYSAGEGDLGGIYQLYSNTENLFVLEGNGANWNALRSDKLPPLSPNNRPYKTRDVAEWARANGYDGVLFKDIRDSGQYGDAGISDVYVFFNPQAQVKSADPVTYDDNGNIIPLSERFNPEKSDIRYSRPVESATIGAVMTSVDEGYKAGKMETLRDTAIATQIAITNAQAGIEAYGKKHGIKDIEARVQAVRSAQGQAGEMIGGHQYRLGGVTNKEKVYLGQGLQEIMRPINDYGKGQKVSKNELKEMREAYKREFFDYLFNHLNVDRMTLESRSMDEQKARLDAQKSADADVKSLTRRYKQILAKIGKLGHTKTDLAEKKTLRAEAKDLAEQIRKLQKEMKERQNEIEAFEPRQNKPVLRKDNGSGGFTEVSADESREQIKKYDEERPEFKEIAEKLWAFLRNLNQYRVDTGLLSQDTADLLADLYAHYVPSYRAGAKVGIAAIDGKRILGVRQTIKVAKGSLKDLLPIDVMIARQVEETVRAGRINQLANILYETAIDGETDEIQILSKDKVTTEEMAEFDPTSMRPKDGQITFYRHGEKIVMRVSKEIFAGFDAFTPQIDSKNPLANTLTAINNTFKKLVTSMNPAFLARNTIRDIQDAGINTKYPKTFVQNYARAAQEILKDGELWRLYRAFGGYSSSIFDFDSGMQGHQNRFGFTQVEGNLLQRGITAIENANAFTEQLPRFAEFISAIEAGKSVEQAILDAADVTTNFGRSGRVTQVLNRTLVPFLNPSIQGFSKMIRNVTSIRTAREFGSFALKVTLIGLLPQAINMLMYGGDDDYEELKDTDKENNFLFKVGDKFVKLPRGRVAAALGGLVNRTASAVKGEDADWWGYVENVLQQVTPVDSMSRDIFSPVRDAWNNTTWYGSPIEGRQFDNTAPKDRYDESTSSIAKAISDGLHAIGLGFGISPKKVHYLLDQYSGVIGDFVLPATTAKPERDFLSGNFTIDPVASNELSTKFYKLYDEAVYARTDGDDTATYQVRYLTKVKNAISDMYDRKREIERSNLSDKEKQAETRVIQILINEAYRTALADYSLYTDAVKATSGIEDANIRFAEATRLVYGAERALKDYDGEVYKRASALKAAGVDYDTYYSYYFSTKDIEADKDIRGNDISGSKRKKVVSTITAMKIPKEQKMILINAAGYAVKDGDIRGVKASTAKGILWRYIRNAKGLTEEQMETLARMCGFSVKNGKIVMNG